MNKRMMTFRLIRSQDVTGISGTGEIALGVEWPDGTCTLYWIAHGTTGNYKSIDQLRDIHCYDNNARIARHEAIHATGND